MPEESANLARVCLESIERAIDVVGPGVNYHDLATTIFDCTHSPTRTAEPSQRCTAPSLSAHAALLTRVSV